MNKVILIGRLGRDPEVKDTTAGTVANFSLATSEGKDKTEWHRIVAWGETAELVAKYLRKGSQCAIEGKLQTRQWETQDGEKRTTTEVVAYRVEFVGDKPGNQTAPKVKAKPRTKPARTREQDSDPDPEGIVPF